MGLGVFSEISFGVVLYIVYIVINTTQNKEKQ